MKKQVIIGSLAISFFLLTGCEQKKEISPDIHQDATSEKAIREKKDRSSKTSESEEEERKEAASTENDGIDKIAEEIKETMKADQVKVIYTSSKAEQVNQGNVQIKLEGYSLLEIDQFQEEFTIPFGNQTTRGGLLLVKLSLTNKENHAILYSPLFDMSYEGSKRGFSNTKIVLDQKYANIGNLLTERKNVVEKGETVEGYFPMALTPDELDEIQKVGMAHFEIPPAYTEGDSVNMSDVIGLPLVFNASGKVESGEEGGFYEDKVTTNNLGTKTMIKNREALNESETLNQITTTLQGYQFVDYEPNEAEAIRYSKLNGVVLITAKFSIENQSEKEISCSTPNSVVRVDDGSLSVLSHGSLVDYRTTDLISPGETKELLQVYVMDKEQYEKLWQDKSYKVELTLSDKEAKTVLDGKSFSFDLK